MKSDRTHGNQSLVFTMKVIVSQFVRDTHKVMTTLKLCVSFGFSGTDTTVTFTMFLWSFHCNLVDIFHASSVRTPISKMQLDASFTCGGT
jgi:hypothetical protein